MLTLYIFKMKEEAKANEISHIKKREIQAPIVSAIIHGFMDEFGKEKTLEVLSNSIRNDAIKSGRALAERFNGNSMFDLATMIREVWCEDGAMELKVLKETEEEFHFDVSKCLYAEVYQKLGISELGKCLSCDRDFPFNEGFNPEIRLERSKTIMEGNEVCDFRYFKKKA